MATLTSKYSLAELAKRLEKGGTVLAKVAEVLSVGAEGILSRFPWMPSNDVLTCLTTRRASLPTATKRQFNAGVATSVSRTAQVRDVIEMLEIRAEYDKRYLNLFPSAAEMRLTESMAFMEGLGQSLLSDILYGNNSTDPDSMTGLAPRQTTANTETIVDAGGSGSTCTSIYVVTPGELTCFLAYPMNSETFGLKHDDLGEIDITDSSSNKYRGYGDLFMADCGLVVRDPLAIGRVGSIQSTGTSNIFDEDDVITLLEFMTINENSFMMANQTVRKQARIALKDKVNVTNWSVGQELTGRPILQFDTIPVVKVDRRILLNTETAI